MARFFFGKMSAISNIRKNLNSTGSTIIVGFIVFVLVATFAKHRKDSNKSCNYIMDYLKKEAPFWKKEVLNGEEHWVEAASGDEAALNRW